MTIPKSAKGQFLTLRAEGKTFRQIAAELNISERTLLGWARELKPQIENLRSFHLESLQNEFHVVKEKRIELLGRKLQTVIDQLETRKLDDLSTAKLFDLMIELTAELKKEVEPIVFNDQPDTNTVDLNNATPRQMLDACKKRLELRSLASSISNKNFF